MRKRSTVNSKQLTVKASYCKNKLLKLFLLLIFYHLSLITSAQSISASLDRDKILLGEQVAFQLNLTNVNTDSFFVASWPHLNDTINTLEFLHQSNIDTIDVNGTKSYQQNFTVTGFDSGRWQLGPFDFMIQNKFSGKQTKISSPAVSITVLPVDVSALKTYHPLKDIIEVSKPFNWLPIIIGVMVTILAIIIFIILKKRKKNIVEVPKIVLSGTPLERAVEKLRKLELQPLKNNADTKKFHLDIDTICREYLEEAANIKAMQATTSELLYRLNIYAQSPEFREQLHDIFDMNASVKFAKYMPSERESKNILDDAIAGLQRIDAIVQQANYNVNKVV